MKFTMTKHVLMDAVQRMQKIATRGIKTDYGMAGRITIDAVKDKVHFITSNGFLLGRWEVTKITDPSVSEITPGITTVDSAVLLKVCDAVGGLNENAVVGVELDGNMLSLKESGGVTKKSAKIETLPKHHTFKSKSQSKKKGFSYEFDAMVFNEGIATVGKYRSPLAYKIKYQMVCLHFLKDELRFACGDGMRFGILSYKTNNPNIEEENGIKHLIPIDQAEIIADVVGAQKLTLYYESPTSCYVNPGSAIELHLHGIPSLTWISYENHAYGGDYAVALDMPMEELREGVKLLEAVKDKKIEKEGGFHTGDFEASSGSLKMTVNEGRYVCEFTGSCSYNKLKESMSDFFKSHYAVKFLSDVVKATDKSTLRFNCIDESSTVIAELMDIGQDADPKLHFFFAPAIKE